MANKILRPRRGKKSTAIDQNLILLKGEVFFEAPETGVGTGEGKIKVGDGATGYVNLPYFLGDANVAESVIEFTESSTTSTTALLEEIVSGKLTNELFGSIKKLLRILTTKSDKLNVRVASYDSTTQSLYLETVE